MGYAFEAEIRGDMMEETTKAPNTPKKPKTPMTSDKSRCMQCQKELSHNEIGAYKKFVNRGADSYLCLNCLAKHFGISVAQIEEKIAYFKAQGCTLFV